MGIDNVKSLFYNIRTDIEGGIQMITDTFDNKTEEIIKVCRNEQAPGTDACIVTFSNEILKSVLDNFECSHIGNLYSSTEPIRYTGLNMKTGHSRYICHM